LQAFVWSEQSTQRRPTATQSLALQAAARPVVVCAVHLAPAPNPSRCRQPPPTCAHVRVQRLARAVQLAHTPGPPHTRRQLLLACRWLPLRSSCTTWAASCSGSLKASCRCGCSSELGPGLALLCLSQTYACGVIRDSSGHC